MAWHAGLETRSLSCKNTSNKHICTAVAVSLAPIVRKGAAKQQRGFIHLYQEGEDDNEWNYVKMSEDMDVITEKTFVLN